jgi:anti-anti-sigma regulatory factor
MGGKLIYSRRFCYAVLSTMFSVEANDTERLITIRWLGYVDSEEMRRCAEEIGVTIGKIRPGFRVLVDMTELESMDYAGAPFIGSIMDLCLAKQVEHVVRVIPNPHKDIGLNIMSYLRYGSKVRITICENLDDAMRRLSE